MADTWLVLGSSPSAPQMLRRALADYPDATTITTNHGIRLLRPDYYFLSDHIACGLFSEQAREMQAEGTQLVTLSRVPSALKARGVDHFNHFLEVPPPGGNDVFSRDVYTHSMFSGTFCAQFAIRNGATRLLLVGHEGYRSIGELDGRRGNDYWLDRVVPTTGKDGARLTRDHIGPWWRSCVATCQDIQFIFYGDLAYEIAGDNLTRVLSDGTPNPTVVATV